MITLREVWGRESTKLLEGGKQSSTLDPIPSSQSGSALFLSFDLYQQYNWCGSNVTHWQLSSLLESK